jgi:UDP-N-acetylmuramate--alanine ligase
MSLNNFKEARKIHFVGIGGIGISAIARMLLQNGKIISGSDANESEITRELGVLGAQIEIGHRAENIPVGCDLLIYTIAANSDNPERVTAKERGVPELSYPEVLGILSREKITIAVAGTHGKTTTTGMLAKIFTDLGESPLVVIGSKLLENKSNFVAGQGQYFIVEACEYRRSFLNLSPTVAIITNIDNDHLDYYANHEAIQSAFREFAERIPPRGALVCDIHNEFLIPILNNLNCQVVDYMEFLKFVPSLRAPGEHNRHNAAAALAVANFVGLDMAKASTALAGFLGTWRRFQYKGKTIKGTIVFDDYGHHPTEIRATLTATREVHSKGKIFVIFQPHLFSRTKLLLEDFAKALTLADFVLILPIYAAREPMDPSITSEMLAEVTIKCGGNAKSMTYDMARKYILENTNMDDFILTLGAGDVYLLGEDLVI